MADGLDKECPEADAECWWVYYYVKPVSATEDTRHSGDFHLARQDSDGKYSHILGGSKILTRKLFLPKVKDGDFERGADNELILDEKEPPDLTAETIELAVRLLGYKYCGKMCCCSKKVNQLAVLDPPSPEDGRCWALISDPLGRLHRLSLPMRGDELERVIAGLRTTVGGEWRVGLGPGSWQIWLGGRARSVLVGRRSISEWTTRQGWRHLVDQRGVGLGQMRRHFPHAPWTFVDVDPEPLRRVPR